MLHKRQNVQILWKGDTTRALYSYILLVDSPRARGGYPIANVIQTTAPLNPGNSGGPLLNYQGQVVGITTAIVEDSQGIGFAILSHTILKEIESLVKDGQYNQHPWLDATGMDLTYEISEAMNTNITYGWLIV